MPKCRMGQNVEWYNMLNGTKCRRIVYFFVDPARIHVHVHVSLSLSICPCPRPRPCVSVRVRVPLGHGHGQGHMDVDLGRFLQLNFREFMICEHTVMSNRFFFLQKIISFYIYTFPHTFSTFSAIFSTLLYI